MPFRAVLSDDVWMRREAGAFLGIYAFSYKIFMMEREGVPAWLACEDILTRMKDELILEAVDILKREMRDGRIDIKGYVAALPEKGEELEQDLFMVNNLIANANEIREQYRSYLNKDAGGGARDPETVSRGEGLRRFLMSVDAIEMLMRLSKVCGVWADDTGVYSSLNDPVEVLRKSAMLDEERGEAAEFVLSSKSFAESEALDDGELRILREALSGIDAQSGHTAAH